MTFNDIFKSSFLESVTEFSVVDTLIGLLFALIVGLFIFLIYKKTFSGVMYSTGFGLYQGRSARNQSAAGVPKVGPCRSLHRALRS